MSVVLDASAVLAMLLNEPGADLVWCKRIRPCWQA
jgi:PIN domain nuclease of toxin-antitoxin system